jgi:hypothetical protein
MKNCKQSFNSVSALTLHLESGACPCGLSRRQIDKWIVEHDLKNTITNPRRMITAGNSSKPVYIPPPTYDATELSWNGSAYECYFCQREFHTLAALNQHLASPKHSTPDGSKLYHCPNNACGLKLSTLSGVVQHIEHGNCGARRFKPIKNTIDGFVDGFKRLTL